MHCMMKEKVKMSPRSCIIVKTNTSKSSKPLLKSQHPSQYQLAQPASCC